MLKLLFDEKKKHIKFKTCRRSNKMGDFYESISEMVNVSGSKVRDLLKNLGKEYRNICQMMTVSGVNTEEKVIKGSIEIFDLFELFQTT